MNIFKKTQKDILSLLKKEECFFVKNPKSLAKVLFGYSDIHYLSRYHPKRNYRDEGNLKYPLMEAIGDGGYRQLVYAAFVATGNEQQVEELTRFSMNMTMDNILKSFESGPLKMNKREIQQYVLINFGTGLGWNKDGYIAPMYEGIDLSIFSGWQNERLPESIAQVLDYTEGEDYLKALERKIEQEKEFNQKKESFKNLVKEADAFLGIKKEVKRIEFSEIVDKYSPISIIPKNAHESYIIHAKEVLEDILNSEGQTTANKKMAKKILNKLEVRK